MIGNIVTSVLAKCFTKLQLSLGILATAKKLIEHLQVRNNIRYHEVRRFKVSAAVASDSNDVEVQSCNGLIQIISDHFDAHIHSQNGLRDTHSCNHHCPTSTQRFIIGKGKRPIPRLRRVEKCEVERN